MGGAQPSVHAARPLLMRKRSAGRLSAVPRQDSSFRAPIQLRKADTLCRHCNLLSSEAFEVTIFQTTFHIHNAAAAGG